MLHFPFHRAGFAAAIVAFSIAGGCSRVDSPTGAARPPRNCVAADSLPGSVALAPDLQRSIAAAGVPAQALVSRRDVCNRLVLEPGMLARQHALDAVDWRPWSPAVLAEAEALDRPLLVLSCFSASASCQAFGRDPLSSRRLARDINTYFVPVLLDRDARPDVDAFLMLASEVLTGSAGWPLVAFLQPDGRPFEVYSWGAVGTGEKKLPKLVEEVLRRISLGGGSIRERAELSSERMQRRIGIDTSGDVPDAAQTQRALLGYLERSFDADKGSFGPPPLFPRAPVLAFLLNMAAHSGDAKAAGMAAAVLAKIREGAIADPVGGGFHRYAARSGWRDPAYEKMLADNAALAAAYLDAAAATGRADFRETARLAADFLLRDLRLPGGAFAVSLSAMGEDASGKPCNGCFYAGSDDVRRSASASVEARERAMQARQALVAPARDDAVLADANALAISALLRAAVVLGEPRYRDAAVAAAEFVDSHLRDGGKVRHCAYADGRVCADGYLSDHALVALAYLDLDEQAGAGLGRWLSAAQAIADELVARFEHEGTGGFFQAGVDAEPLPLRLKPELDAAVASGNSAAAMLFARLASRTGDPRYAAIARRTFEAFSEVLTLRPLALPSMVTALDAWSRAAANASPGVLPATNPAEP